MGYIYECDSDRPGKEAKLATKSVIDPKVPKAKTRRVRFGDVTVTAPAPPRASVERNVKLSTQALERVARRLARPGTVLRTKKNVPLFSVDSDNPDILIRQLNGKTERGTIVDDAFQAID
ncbi:hypothetical protein [Novosphingobium naphthalenivorans]|jgi:hypothetical protein|uniref:hypothetical protein n=1 Tax=Novosphingobium naphthalenivorans TaxID=273168 RepID=UPI00045130DB|nr:hypothetical protein [Novosphingobium naphthalenivorans]EZP65309.1 hypothetical protein BV96_04693 [Sphingomonas paucimobilis]